MVERLERDQYLLQRDAVNEIELRFRREFTYNGLHAGSAIDRRVLEAFRRMTKDTVVWERRLRQWRKRQAGDEAGRRRQF